MKFSKPKLLKKYQDQFEDARGFLNPTSLIALLKMEELGNFDPRYQLMSFTKNENTFRGFHFQKPPSQQIKVIIVHSGKILDFVFPYEEKKEENIITFQLEAGDVLLIPDNYAHGFYTESSNVLLQYIMNYEYVPEDYTGFNGLEYISKKINKNNILISKNDLNLPHITFD